MAAMSARRITRDADLATVGVGNDEAVVAAAVAEIVATKLDVDDGLAFDADSEPGESRDRQPACDLGVELNVQLGVIVSGTICGISRFSSARCCL